MRKACQILLVVVSVLCPAASFARSDGILLLAHGGSAEWNGRVEDLSRKIDATQPTEVAFGMASRQTIQAAVDRLAARGVTRIVAVPLFISSWSSVITSTEYLLGLRADAPPELRVYAAMDHGAHGSHGAQTAADPTPAPAPMPTPVQSKATIVGMSSALNAHRVVADILTTRARSISADPSQEAVVLVAHGPVGDGENQRWLADMRVLAQALAQADPFGSIDVLTLRDDAPKPVRDAATAELRAIVSARIAAGRRVLIVPLLLSFGGIERGLAARLQGLSSTLPAAAVMPDDRLIGWVLDQARTTGASTETITRTVR